MKRTKPKLIKDQCEVADCGVRDANLLHLHHIVERTMVNTSNHPFNLAILCANHHEMTHSGRLKIIGVFPATLPPNGRALIYELDGVRNIDGIDEPYYVSKNKSMKIYG